MEVPALLFMTLLCITSAQNLLKSHTSTCETLPSTVHVTKEEYNDQGVLERTCEDDVTVSKCDGMCASQVQPSVVHYSGFLKECMCCRESYLRERYVLLSRCFDPDGIRLNGPLATLEVKLREPSDCKCSRCGDGR